MARHIRLTLYVGTRVRVGSNVDWRTGWVYWFSHPELRCQNPLGVETRVIYDAGQPVSLAKGSRIPILEVLGERRRLVFAIDSNHSHPVR